MNFWNLDKTWIVAEIGVNHEGDSSVAADLIRLAAETGVDAVKFQTFRAEQYVSSVQPERLQRVRKFQLSYETFRQLAQIAKEHGVTFFSTPLHMSDVDFLDEIVPVFKVSSGDLTYRRLIAHIASKDKPIIMSTGLGTREEIQAAVDTVLNVRPDARKKGELMLLHCVAAYPTPAEEANLANIGWLRETFGLPVGYSDHTLGIKACELAVAAEAVLLEKHFTYRKENQEFHDHAISADPDDMRQLVLAVREAETYQGAKERVRGPSEEKMLLSMRRSVGAAVDIPFGQPVRREWLTYLRPAWGLPADQLDAVVGRRLQRAVPAGDLIRAEDLKP
ncbi:N-acetylneuraminate synthase family protein [Acidobacteria bacterium AH-259-A15]|nr:N-acetylneuraminate synthase family protein [Acidobacteria bacterium AH-259-A15]